MEQKKPFPPLPGTALDFFIMLLISFLSIAYFLWSNPEHLLVFDDSYITLKFAANFFKYNGITYDGSTFLSGATSPLHIVCIALLGRFMGMEEAALTTGVIFFILSSFIVYLWILALYGSRRTALLGGMLTATSGWLIFDSLSGLETTAFLFFSLLTFYLHYRYRDRLAYIIPLFLAILTRPEGWFLAGALWVSQVAHLLRWRDTKAARIILMSIGIVFMLCVPYFLLCFRLTGSLLPGTAFAKAVFFAEFHTHAPRIWMFKHGVEYFYKVLLYPLPLAIFPLILFAGKVIRMPYLWLYCGFFYLSYFLFFPGATLQYWCRYQHIFLPLIVLAITGGAFELFNRCKTRTLKMAVGTLMAVSLVYNQIGSFRLADNTYSNQIDCVKHVLLELSTWLKQNTPEDSLIAIHDIGVVGYFSNRPLLELVGLINPEVITYYWDSRSKKSFNMGERKVMDYLKEKRPDYLVMFYEWDRFFNLLTPENEKYFQLLHTTLPLYPTEMRYRVFKCRWDNND